MSIKADKWIKRQCTPPLYMVTENYVGQKSHPMQALMPRTHEVPSYKNSLQLDKEIEYAKTSSCGSRSYRSLTVEEVAAFVPMISPFVSGQVREDERNATEAEYHRLMHCKSLEDALVLMPANCRDVRKDPLLGMQVREKIVSYGTSSFGYDVRLGDEFKVFTDINNSIIDPLNFDHKSYVDQKGPYCIIPPNSYILGMTIEKFVIPKNVMVVCVGKSTYARCGAIVNVTPIEAGFAGNVVIEISNATRLPIKVYANQGIAQFLFYESDEDCEVSYADRGGKYMGQSGITTAKV